MALRVGPRGLEVKIDAAYGGLRSSHGPCGPLSVRRFRDFEDGVGFSLLRGTGFHFFPSAWNNQLRTGADKGNPTV